MSNFTLLLMLLAAAVSISALPSTQEANEKAADWRVPDQRTVVDPSYVPKGTSFALSLNDTVSDTDLAKRGTGATPSTISKHDIPIRTGKGYRGNPAYLGVEVRISYVQVQEIIKPNWVFLSKENDRHWLANQLAAGLAGNKRTGHIDKDIGGGWKFEFFSRSGWTLAGIPSGLAFVMASDAILAAKLWSPGANGVRWDVADNNGNPLFILWLFPQFRGDFKRVAVP